MFRKILLVLEVGLFLGFGLTLSAGADDTALERPGFALTTLDGSGNVGQYSSVAIGTDGLALISYYDASNGDLKVAHCSDLACTSATRTTLQSEDNVGLFTSVTIGTDGLGLISYYDASNGDLKMAHCSDLACTTTTRTTLTFLQSEGNVGQFTSVTITGGHGLISYYDSTDQVLKLALCPDLACTDPTVTNTPDRTGNVGQYSSVAIGTDGLALISYYDATNGDLKVAHCFEAADSICTSATRTTLQSEDNVGQFTAMTIGTDGLALISYYDVTNGDLKVAHCSDEACTSATIATPDSAGSVGQYSSVTIGTDSLALISYYDATNGDLGVAHCSDVACTSATVTAVDGAANNVGAPSSMIIGTDGRSLISYFDKTNGDLKVAHCSDVACTAVTLTTVDGAADNVGAPSSIIMGADSRGLISYYDETNGDLKVAHCSNVACTSATLTTLDSAGSVGEHNSVTIGADGRGLISYYDATNGNLKVAHCSDVACTTTTLTAVDSAGNVGQYSSVTIGIDGLGLISYFDATNGDLKVAHCSNVACTAATLTAVDSAGSVGQYSSVTIGADGLALISYYDETNGDLKVAHCSNLFCVPYHRRR